MTCLELLNAIQQGFLLYFKQSTAIDKFNRQRELQKISEIELKARKQTTS